MTIYTQPYEYASPYKSGYSTSQYAKESLSPMAKYYEEKHNELKKLLEENEHKRLLAEAERRQIEILNLRKLV